ncbi:Acetyl-CoA acetyltransferase, mitochondrial [Tilletia horrida]|uniref:acetyl-CoA C-acetyltransferase n=1 Tax=Tilletia horrida TaxID=155126 RepID=A0AAN6GP71_9BASI|nr:Acetyl-CoA acetyltransferase, mitochondrial [Tilletia horrida]KAK0550327.1 Acetyl-CoA acetyltransferase, mitochondrial [Tilletia horrida]KAK0565454.1 Acetyl-CoA acetyltransferase, mitochondrial [Tilletia horrida]
MDVFIVSAARTPIGSFNGVLKKLTAPQLGVTAVKAAISRAGLQPADIEDAYIGNVLQGSVGQAPARQVVLGAGCPDTTEATTINKVCASGLKAVSLAAQNIALGQRTIMVAGGMESMSNAPYYAPRGLTYGSTQFHDAIVKDGLTDAQGQVLMGVCAESTAKKHNLTREDQDAYAIESYKRAAAAWERKAFAAEIAPVTIPDPRKGDVEVAEDEEYKNVKMDKIPTLRPVFQKDGTVTAANASTLNDGASAVVLASQAAIDKHGLKPLAKIVAFADAACAPIDFPIAPAHAIPLALERAKLTKDDIALFEINEAFSAVALANNKILGLDASKVNVLGGGVSLGHPIGSSGSRILVTLVHALKSSEYGVAGVCNGGGGASAMVIQKL